MSDGGRINLTSLRMESCEILNKELVFCDFNDGEFAAPVLFLHEVDQSTKMHHISIYVNLNEIPEGTDIASLYTASLFMHASDFSLNVPSQ